ncbi:tRNA glutamyl-Q(34) synthetase GluQRS [Billgrantia endophytica]|uniref:Glutamyl-Q tRNA(Asp) synthetase n=1 Tax=Billgrantia endophytica TaxID=2033802 RepID=A0A2N7U666_9GAMM|nr:tRNA glutamyl-Q(34) synthetase GluQRS [Halomonas endophytica]PMR75933.1 tRNA glutamyl-Q(34) synthetase GluQRS [Halomonas endophytica]
MTPYRGRFAPTPSGALHFGSLIAAVASYLDARQARGEWLLRIEDIDPPRCPPGAADAIQHQLEAFGLYWDGPVYRQHDRDHAYGAALERLEALGLAYPCSCSRKQWHNHPIYPGWCRDGVCEPDKPVAWRLRSDLGLRPVSWEDRLFGTQSFDPAELGDVVLKRKEGLWAYQLAVVVDDADRDITDVVRGFDLLDNTPWQRQLQHALGLPEPRYLHLPLIMSRDGQKLSKQNLAPALPLEDAAVRPLLHQALVALDQSPPPALATGPVDEQLAWAIAHWDVGRISPDPARRADDHATSPPSPA